MKRFLVAVASMMLLSTSAIAADGQNPATEKMPDMPMSNQQMPGGGMGMMNCPMMKGGPGQGQMPGMMGMKGGMMGGMGSGMMQQHAMMMHDNMQMMKDMMAIQKKMLGNPSAAEKLEMSKELSAMMEKMDNMMASSKCMMNMQPPAPPAGPKKEEPAPAEHKH